MPMHPPPWIILLLLAHVAMPEEGTNVTTTTEAATETGDEMEEANTTLTRMYRGTSIRDERQPLITQYPTYYLARSYTNEVGERRNVLIPVQATPASETSEAGVSASTPRAEIPDTSYQGVSPAPSVHSPTQIYALTQDMLMTLHKAGLIAEPPTLSQSAIEMAQPTPAPTPLYTGGLVYALRVPAKPSKMQSPTINPPSIMRFAPERQPQPLPQPQAYTTKVKPTATKLYNIEYRPHRIRTRPNKNKYTSTKLQFSLPTTASPSPYTNKVRFELEDARVPPSHSIALKAVSSTQSTAPQTFTATTADIGLSQYLEAAHQKQFYFAQEGQTVGYVPPPGQHGTPSPSAAPVRLPPSSTSRPHIDSNRLQYIDENALNSLVQPPPTRPSTLTALQHYSPVSSQSDERNPAPHVEYVQITDIDVAPQGMKQPQLHYAKLPSREETKSKIQQQHLPQGPTRATPTHFHRLLHAHNLKINPQPQLTFASDSGDIRASARPPSEPESEFLPSQAKPNIPAQYAAQNDLKSTAEPNIEFIQSNEVTFAPEIMQFPPVAQGVRTQTHGHSHYVNSNGQYVENTPNYLQAHAQYVQETNAVTPAAPPQQPQPYQYSTSNPNDPTPSIELEYTDGKFPPMVQEAYNILKDTEQLPHRITPDNIDGSIKTLALILQKLQQYQRQPTAAIKHIPIKLQQKEPYRQKPHYSPSAGEIYEDSSRGSTPGRPGVDYPTYHKIPKTSFDCTSQRYKGFFGDPDTRCQVWHYCDLNGGQASFLCPNGTIFNQVALTCDWWFNVKCSSTSQLYVLNERLYKYILPFSPSFPEDYSGPVVDRYLTAKFKEQETKAQLKAVATTAAPESSSTHPEVRSTTTSTQ